jgi:serine/threonine protein kinase
MRPDRFARVKQLLLQVVDLPEHARLSFLDQACGDDLDLRAEVLSLMARDGKELAVLKSKATTGDSGNLADIVDQTVKSGDTLPLVGESRYHADTDRMDAEMPATIGRYQVTGELGRGGMGVVYVGLDERTGRRVAIKTLPPQLADNKVAVKRLERESRLLTALEHPNIATILSREDAAGRVFLTLELIPGETLADRLDRGRPPVDEALRICSQVTAALEAAHARDIIHRDVKPANIKITPSGQVKVLDFGIGKALSGEAEDSWRSTATGKLMIIGTIGYMSPEQLGGRELDRFTDIWSLGCVIYECLTGIQAFAGRSVGDVLLATMRSEPDWSALPQDTPPRVQHLLRQCLAKGVGERFGDLDVLRRALSAPLTIA